MKIAVIGAGNIGKVIISEALSRGHQVTAVVRDPAKLTLSHAALSVTAGDVTDAASIAAAVAGHDAVVNAVGPNYAIGNIDILPQSVRTLITALKQAGVARLLVVGGAGSLEVAPGLRLYDTPDFPEARRPSAKKHGEGLALLRAETALEWTFFSPAAIIEPGQRTGTFRLGGDQLLADAAGNSRISIEDYAVAVVNELETPAHIRARFTIAY